MLLKILAIYPGLNPTFDEVAFALPPLLAHGCKVRVITSRMSTLKSDQHCAAYEDFHGVEIFRPYIDPFELTRNAHAHRNAVLKLAGEFAPDVLFLNSFRALPLSHMIRRQQSIPTLLRLETADPLSLLQRRFYLGWPSLGRILGRVKWWRVAGHVDALMTNDPVDRPHLAQLGVRGRQAFYAGHCAQQPDGWHPAITRDKGEMIYIGSMIRHKNCDAWLDAVPAILENTPVERFTVIGRGPYEHVVKSLQKRFGDRVCYIPGVTRQEALEKLSGAYFAYTEATSGWGFLCDAWSTRTPVLCPQSTFGIVPDSTGIMPKDRDELIAKICRLYADEDYYRALQEGGVHRFETEHTAEIVSQQYLNIFNDVLMHRSGSST